jgi:hypothetical protein
MWWGVGVSGIFYRLVRSGTAFNSSAGGRRGLVVEKMFWSAVTNKKASNTCTFPTMILIGKIKFNLPDKDNVEGGRILNEIFNFNLQKFRVKVHKGKPGNAGFIWAGKETLLLSTIINEILLIGNRS